MIRINGFEKEFTLDLNKHPYDEHTINIESKGEGNTNIPWGVEMVSCDLVTAKPGAGNTLNVNVDIDELSDECFILLRNYTKERMKITVIPNTELSAPKTYKFRITKKSTDGRKTRIRILSKENGKEIGWSCTYNGQPYEYSISPMKGDKSGYVDIVLTDELLTTVTSLIEFTQEKSGEVIQLKLRQSNDSTEIIKAD
jgi:hypothetical protein